MNKAVTSKKWFSVSPGTIYEARRILDELNRLTRLHSNDQTYYKVFTWKVSSKKFQTIFFATEGNIIVSELMTTFRIVECESPNRKLLTRIAGFAADRPWMLQTDG